MVKTVDSVLLLWIEWALNNEAEAKADVAGVFAANEDWLSARVVIDWHVEFLAFFEIPILEHLDDFLFATTQATGDDKLHIIGRMSATMVLTDIFEFNIIDSLKTLRVSEDFFTKFLLEFWPDEATIVVLVASKLRADITFLADEFFFVEFWQSDGELLKLQNTLPLKISTFCLIGNEDIRGPGVVIGTVFSELRLVGLLIFKKLIATKSHMLHKMGNFVNLRLFDEFVTGAKNHADIHDAGARSVDEKAASAVFEVDFFDRMFHILR